MIKLGIIGAAGRMGKAILAQLSEYPTLTLTSAVTCTTSELLGLNVGVLAPALKTEVVFSGQLQSSISQLEVLIDFTRPEATLETLKLACQSKCPVVIGTTGFTAQQQQKIYEAAHLIPILLSPNMSIGVNLLYALLAMATKTMGETADIEIVEMHHRHKIDAPSGTALKMGEVVAETLAQQWQINATFDQGNRHGLRKAHSIGFASLRGGDVIGDHTAIFADMGERIEITHKASDRGAFAKGAIIGAIWLSQRKAGLYQMHDVLGFDRH